MQKIKIGIIDDSEHLRVSLAKLFHLEIDLEVVLLADDGTDLLEKLALRQPEVILMDIRMPGKDGIELTRDVMHQYPSIKIIALTFYAEPKYIIGMHRLGVKSFIRKGNNVDELLKAIRVTYSGGTYLTDDVSCVIQEFLNRHNTPTANISLNERKLVRMLMDGLHSKEIGLKLFKSHRTIEDMREKLYLKFNVKNKEQLIGIASKWEWEAEPNKP